MKLKTLKLSAVLLLGLGITLNAQTKLYVKEKAGTQTAFDLSSIKKLTFPASQMTVTKTNGSAVTYGLSSVRYLSFNSVKTDIIPIESLSGSYLTLYPNPVIDQLQISYKMAQTGIVQLKIVDLQGKVIYSQILNSQNGTNHATISVAQLPVGLYIFLMQSETKLETKKFYKN